MSKFCQYCDLPIIQRPTESNGNYRRRTACGSPGCQKQRKSASIRRAAEIRLQKAHAGKPKFRKRFTGKATPAMDLFLRGKP